MASGRFAWGIDIGNRALKAVKLVRDAAGQLKIDDFEIIEHETVLSQAGDNRDSLIQTALANFVQRHQIKGGACAVGVNGQSSFARFIKLPPVEPKKIPEIVRFEAIQQIPFPLDEVEWGYQLFQTPDSPEVEVGIFAMRKELVNAHIKYFTDVDMNVQAVQMNPLAVYNAMRYEQRLDGTTMVIDMGAENTDLIISEGETIWLRSIPVGGNNFTETLVKTFKLNFSKAEEMKRTASASKFAKQIFQAMRPVFSDLVAEIQRSIGFYASVHAGARISKIIALGGTFRLPGLQKYLQQNLQLDVEVVKELAIGQPGDAKLAAAYNENLLSVASAYGLAVQAMGEAKINSSLLPAAIQRERVWKDKTKWFGLAAACIVGGTLIGYGRNFAEGFRLEQAAKDYQPQIASITTKAQDLDRRWQEIETQGGPQKVKINNIRSLEQYRRLWPDLLLDIRAALPTPQPELLSGDVEKIKSIPRKQRRMIEIESISTAYTTNMQGVLDDPNFKRYTTDAAPAAAMPVMSEMGMNPEGLPPDMMPPPGLTPPGGTPPPAGAGVKRGLLVTIKCVTPNEKGADFANETFIKKLAALTEDKVPPGKDYYVAKSTLASVIPFSLDTARLTLMTQAYAAIEKEKLDRNPPPPGMPPGTMGGPGMPPMMGMPPPGAPAGPGQAVDPAPFLDRLTHEDTREDFAFTVLFAVVLDPAPKPATPTPPPGQ